jgi:hypothetical protein
MNKVKLYIPSGCARNAKLNGAIYDKDTKTWYCDINDQLCIDWYERKYLREPTTDNELKHYKLNEVKYDRYEDKWYCFKFSIPLIREYAININI